MAIIAHRETSKRTTVMEWFTNFRFANPELLLLLALPVALLWLYGRRQRPYPELRVPSLAPLSAVRSWRTGLRRFLPAFRLLALASLVIALARPQEIFQKEEIKAEGIDIFLVMDLSNSMLSKDFDPNRLEASKAVAQEFVRKRPYDRIGLAAFAGEAFTLCPLTTDHRVVQEFLGTLTVDLFVEQNTAIGMGLATAVNRLKTSASKSKIVILLTDGMNNAGYIPPMTAAEVAQKMGVRVYTIGIGSNGFAMSPYMQRSNGQVLFRQQPVRIDEELLQEIAQMTGGKYYRAASQESLLAIYDEIDLLEKTELDITTITRYGEVFHPFALAAVVLLLFEFLLRYLVLRSIP